MDSFANSKIKIDYEKMSNIKFCIPKGFRNLLESLTMEILRHQPKDINSFAANYFKQRLQARQENGYDECLLGSQIDGFYKFDKERQGKFEAAAKIQSNYRGFAARKKLTNGEGKPVHNKNTEEHQERERYGFCDQNIKPINWMESEVKTNVSYQDYRTSTTESNSQRAATTIQSRYRGYKTRKQLNTNVHLNHAASQVFVPGHITAKEKERARETQIEKCSSIEDVQAATKIQAHYRGYKTRKENQANAYGILTCRHSASSAEILAATQIQAGYRGYRVRKQIRRRHLFHLRQQYAATKIQASYRGYITRKTLRETGPQMSLLTVDSSTGEDLIQPYDSRFSFSLSEDVKFEGSLDDDSDTEIDKVIHKMQALKGTAKNSMDFRVSKEDTAEQTLTNANQL